LHILFLFFSLKKHHLFCYLSLNYALYLFGCLSFFYCFGENNIILSTGYNCIESVEHFFYHPDNGTLCIPQHRFIMGDLFNCSIIFFFIRGKNPFFIPQPSLYIGSSIQFLAYFLSRKKPYLCCSHRYILSLPSNYLLIFVKVKGKSYPYLVSVPMVSSVYVLFYFSLRQRKSDLWISDHLCKREIEWCVADIFV